LCISELTHSQNQPSRPNPQSFNECARNGFEFYQSLQLSDGHWACDYGGPSFLLPGLMFAMYITDADIPKEWKAEMTQYLAHHVNPDGGWGLHLEGESTVFATTMYYVLLRIFGMEPEHPLAARARECILANGKCSFTFS
jgi:lanosterol synthase